MKAELKYKTEKEFQERFWDKAYRKGAKPKFPLQLKKIQKLIGEICDKIERNRRDIKILDIGCGTGELLAAFAQRYKCFGIDISSEAVLRAKEKEIHAKQHNIEEGVPFDDDFFDVIMMSEVLEHVINTDYALTEINRVLHRNGFFLLTIPNINSPISLILQLLFDYPPLYSSRYKSIHVRDFTLRTIRKALINNGFKPIQTTGTYIYPFANVFSKAIANLVPRFSEMIILVSTKEGKLKTTPEVAFDVREI